MERSYTQALRVVLGCVLAWLASACSSDAASPQTIALSDFPDRYAQALCHGVEPCCASAMLPYDATACTNAATDSIIEALGILASRPDAVYDPAAAAECLRELETAIRACSVDGAHACAYLFTGTLAVGAACTTSSQCAGMTAYCSADGMCALTEPTACETDASQCPALDPDAATAQRCAGTL